MSRVECARGKWRIPRGNVVGEAMKDGGWGKCWGVVGGERQWEQGRVGGGGNSCCVHPGVG